MPRTKERDNELRDVANDVLTNPKWADEVYDRNVCLAPTTHMLARAFLRACEYIESIDPKSLAVFDEMASYPE